MSKVRKVVKKFMKKYYEFQSIINLTGGFALIMAFIIVLPNFIELQMAWLIILILFSIAIRITIEKLGIVFPELKEEVKQEYVFDEKIEDLNDKIEKLEGRLKKIGEEKGKEK